MLPQIEVPDTGFNNLGGKSLDNIRQFEWILPNNLASSNLL